MAIPRRAAGHRPRMHPASGAERLGGGIQCSCGYFRSRAAIPFEVTATIARPDRGLSLIMGKWQHGLSATTGVTVQVGPKKSRIAPTWHHVEVDSDLIWPPRRCGQSATT